jgi:primase/DNA polymerase family protein/uncharacterized protein DUF5906
MLQLPAALATLGLYRQFIVYVLVPRPDKTDKFPVDHRTGQIPAKGGGGAHDPSIWTDFATAANAARVFGPGYGVGFVFTRNDPFWFLDIDGCLAPGATTWSALALQLLAALPGAAVEISSSGKGLHVIGTGTAPEHGCKNQALGLEFYTEGRFIALTGTSAQGDVGANLTPVLPWLVNTFFPPRAPGEAPADWTNAPVAEWSGPTDDDALIQRILNSRPSANSAFGNRASVKQIWERDVEALGKTYPDKFRSPPRPYDDSDADMALAQHLAWWTGNDCERIQRLMLRSGLVRDKWERDDYLYRTILEAVRMQKTWLNARTAPAPATAPVLAGVTPANPQPIDIPLGLIFEEQMVQLFAGCAYVRKMHMALIPGGNLIKPDIFSTIYGGRVFIMDPLGEKVTDEAWKAFTRNQRIRFPQADDICFKPRLQPGALIQHEGQILVNTYWPTVVERIKGDAAPFWRHLEKVLPLESDRRILINYLAACVQYQGVKFKWAPLLQGVEGNGKTFFSMCVARAIGDRYVHWPRADQLTEKYNGWLFDNIFIAVNDVYTSDQKIEMLEILKPMITDLRLPRRDMGVSQRSADVCANWLFNSNHRDAIRKTQNDRRFAPFYTAQQNEADLIRDGMTEDYFVKLFHWFYEEKGAAIVADLLYSWPIDEALNPATLCVRAPTTSSTNDAIRESMGAVEQEILEAVDQGIPGFAGGWISSIALTKLLERLNLARRIPPNRRKELLAVLGYEMHPHLPDGRVHNAVAPDNGKPRLYIKKGHLARNLSKMAEIMNAYSAAQQVVITVFAPPASTGTVVPIS